MKVKIKNFLDTASRKRLITASCWLGLVGLALMSWSLFDQGWIPVMAAMSVGQGIGTLSFALYLLVVIIELRQAQLRPSYRAKQRERGDH
jgi:CHASE2 domain-containing sensor protein